MADFLVALAAFDARRRWADLGHANLWAFLHRDLGLSAGAAHGRKVAARLVREFPAVEAALRDGRLCLSSVVELARVLTPANEAEVLPRYFRLSAREAREVTAELAPRPVIPVREVVTATAAARWSDRGIQTSESSAGPPVRPAPPPGAPGDARTDGGAELHRGVPGLDGPPAVDPSGLGVAVAQADLTGEIRAVVAVRPASAASSAHGPAGPAGPAPGGVRPPNGVAGRAVAVDEVLPISADLRRLHLTVSRRFLDKLEAAKSLRSHAQPRASAADVLEAALDLLLAREAKRKKAAAARPARRPRLSATDRVTAAVRREVWVRDQGRCQWPLEAGGVCGSTYRVEVDHVHHRGRGGASTPANLRLLCGPHNAESARRAYGAKFMAKVVAEARQARTAGRAGTAGAVMKARVVKRDGPSEGSRQARSLGEMGATAQAPAPRPVAVVELPEPE